MKTIIPQWTTNRNSEDVNESIEEYLSALIKEQKRSGKYTLTLTLKELAHIRELGSRLIFDDIKSFCESHNYKFISLSNYHKYIQGKRCRILKSITIHWN